MPGLESHHPAFRRIAPEGTTIEHLATGFRFTEGPVWRGDHLLFSDIPSNRIVRYQRVEEGPVVTTFRHPSGNSNGHTLDKSGRLISCEHSNRRVSRTEPDGSVTVLASHYQGGRLNSPNDVVVRSDGVIFFTDPPYGLGPGEPGKEQPANGVFRLDPDGTLTCLATDFDRPNGLALSPDEHTLYVDDTVVKHIRAFAVDHAGALSQGRMFAEMRSSDRGGADGMKVDVEGNVYCTGPGGVWVFASDGTQLGRISPPENPANVGWGGPDGHTLFMTAQSSLYSVHLGIKGVAAG